MVDTESDDSLSPSLRFVESCLQMESEWLASIKITREQQAERESDWSIYSDWSIGGHSRERGG